MNCVCHEQKRVFTYLGGFDVVVKVISECLYMGYALLSPLGREMAWEEHCGYRLSVVRV